MKKKRKRGRPKHDSTAKKNFKYFSKDELACIDESEGTENER